MHDARHVVATVLADQNLSPKDIAELLGHTTSAITESTYLHAFNAGAREERIRRAMEAARTAVTA
jgi:predicted transcriptional regulator